MKALAILQPWAWAIIHAGKDIENRSWPSTYRGPLLIHASKGMTNAYFGGASTTINAILDETGSGLWCPDPSDLQFGGIIGRVDMVDCVRESDSPWFFGQFGFKLTNAAVLPFRSLKGALGFFDPDSQPEPVRKVKAPIPDLFSVKR